MTKLVAGAILALGCSACDAQSIGIDDARGNGAAVDGLPPLEADGPTLPPSDGRPGAPDAGPGRPDASAGDAASTPSADAPPSTPGTKALGTATLTQVACPSGSPAGATCYDTIVRCPDLDDMRATLAVREPAVPTHTVVLHGGGGGTDWLDNHGNWFDKYLARGFRVVAVKWNDWWECDSPDPYGSGARSSAKVPPTTCSTSGPAAGLAAAACRPATLFRAVFDQPRFHAQNLSQGMCVQGHSGGSGAVGLALAWYGIDNAIDFAMVSAGPVFTNLERGCLPNSGDPRTSEVEICTSQPQKITYGSQGADLNDLYVGLTRSASNCSGANYTAGIWTAQGILPAGDTDYTDTSGQVRTKLEFYFCANNANISNPQGSILYNHVRNTYSSWSSRAHYTCSTACGRGERPWIDAQGNVIDAEISAMADLMNVECRARP